MTLEKTLEELGFKKSEHFKEVWQKDWPNFHVRLNFNKQTAYYWSSLTDLSDSYNQWINFKNLVDLQNKLLKAEQNARYMLGVGESE